MGKGPCVEDRRLEGVEMVLAFTGKSKDNDTKGVDQSVPLHIIAISIGVFIKLKLSKATSSNIVQDRTIVANARNVHNLPSLYYEKGNSKHCLQNRIITWLKDNQVGWTTDVCTVTRKN